MNCELFIIRKGKRLSIPGNASIKLETKVYDKK